MDPEELGVGQNELGRAIQKVGVMPYRTDGGEEFSC